MAGLVAPRPDDRHPARRRSAPRHGRASAPALGVRARRRAGGVAAPPATPARPARRRWASRAARSDSCAPLERREVLLQRHVVEPVDVGQHLVHRRHPGRVGRARPAVGRRRSSGSSAPRGRSAAPAPSWPQATPPRVSPGRTGPTRRPARRSRRGAPSRRRDRRPPAVRRLVPDPSTRSRAVVHPRPPPPARHRPSSSGAAQPGRPSAVRSRPTQVGRSSGPRPPGRAAPSRRSSPAASRVPASCAPAMSVCRLSPTISGRSPPTRRRVSSNSGRSGLPATCGLTPAKPLIIPTSVPCPGAGPSPVGSVGSVFVATHGSPFLISTAARMIVLHRTSGRVARTIATASCVADLDRLQPGLAQRLQQPVRAQHGDPGPRAVRGRRSSRAAACEEVTTSSGSASTPSSRRCSATCLGSPRRRCW